MQSSVCLALARSKDISSDFEAELKLVVRKAHTKVFKDVYSVYLERILPNPDYSKSFYNGHNKEIAIEVFKDVIREGGEDMNYILENVEGEEWKTMLDKFLDKKGFK